MRRYFVGVVLLSVLFSFVATQAFAQQNSSSSSSSSISGTVTNASSGAPVAGAAVQVLASGASQRTTTDAKGAFSFSGLAGGTYSVRTTAQGFQVSVSAPFSLGVNENVQLAVSLQPLSVSSLRTIASLRINGRQAVNTSSAPTVSITNRQFVTHGQVLVEQALEQTPGVTVEHYDGGLGSVATLTIRGAGGFTNGGNNTGYELLILQDGQPIRNGQFGDVDLSALTPAIYSRVEVLKGVGGTTLFGANSIGGTLNLVTRDPLATQGGEFIGGIGSYGTYSYDLISTDTIGKFGYIFDYHRLGSDGPVAGSFIADYWPNNFNFTGTPCPAQASCGPLFHPTQNFDLHSGLLKMRYAFSPSTTLTLSGQDESDMRDETGLLSNYDAVKGVVNDPAGFPYFFGFPGETVWNIQPKITADLHTQVGGGDLILRSYGGILERVVDGNNEPPGTCCFLQRSMDRLYGDEAYWTRVFGRHTLTVAAGGNSDSYFFGTCPSFPGPNCPASGSIDFNQISYTSGNQIQRTYMLNDQYEASPRLQLNLTTYYSTYTTPQARHFDPRFGLVYKPDVSTAVRFSVATGFAVAPLSFYFMPLNTFGGSSVGDPRCPSGAPYFGFCAAPTGNLNLQPETAVGGDLGADHTFGYANRGLVSLDLYRTQLSSHVYNVNVPAPPGTGNFTGSSPPGGSPILFINEPINLARAVYTGFEFSTVVPVTHNFSITGNYATQAAYPNGLDVFTQTNAGDTVNNEQFAGVPLHQAGYGLRYDNSAGAEGFMEGVWFAPNNAFFVPPFWIYNAGLTLPLQGDSDLTATWTNIFNKNAAIWSTFLGGVPYPGFTGPFAETAHPANPVTFMVTLTHRWGSMRTP